LGAHPGGRSVCDSLPHDCDIKMALPAETTHQAIVFEDVSIQFEDNPVLDGVSFALKRGETKILLGIAGAGKSTILKMTLGLVKPDRGRIVTLGYEVSSMREEELFDLRRKVGMVFQESAVFDTITSTRIIELIVKQRDFYKTSALMVTHRLQDAFIMASHYFDSQTNQMRPISAGSGRNVHTTFLLLRDGKVIFDGTAPELARSEDDYIREYIA